MLQEIESDSVVASSARDGLRTIADRHACALACVADGTDCEDALPGLRYWTLPDADFRGVQNPGRTRLNQHQWLVVFPEPGTPRPQTFAVGTITGVSEDALERLIDSAWQNTRLIHQNSAQQEQLNQYADQVLHDFSEIDWMHKLVARLKLCSLSNSTIETATGLLLPLRELVRAEAMAFISADTEQPGRVPMPDADAFPGVWMADNTRLQTEALRLVRRYVTEASCEVVVRNRKVRWAEADQFPQVTGFMMCAVRRESRLIGWVIGINRLAGYLPFEDYSMGVNSMHTEAEFSTAEAGLLSSAASVLATHDDNVRLLKGNINLSLGTIRALANAVDAKDEYTRGHSDRVARMVNHLGRLMGLNVRECQQLLMTGLLHDVGKIGVPDEVLRKPGRLSDSEFALIRKHPVSGFNILEPVAELWFALPGVLHHHEAFDGSGYPSGLAGGRIPVVARMLAVVDAYDAMTSDRPYRRGMGYHEAEVRIRDGAGRFWDPELVKLFLRHKADFRLICQEARPQHDSVSMLDTREIVLGDTTQDSVFAEETSSHRRSRPLSDFDRPLCPSDLSPLTPSS